MKAGKLSKSWREKLEKQMQPAIVEVPDSWAKRIGQGKMLVPTPLLVDGVVREIPKGKLATVNMIREKLAKDFRTDMACPLTTGIFLNITANTAEEDQLKGKKKPTPYWRVIKSNGQLNQKFPGGITRQAKYLKAEGFNMLKGKSKKKHESKRIREEFS
jgi:6-O-methylguanine DNA methyltransferase, DNA binding domain